MSVTFDNVATVTGASVTSLTTPSFRITARDNRAGLLTLAVSTTGITAITGSMGGVSGVAIANADSEEDALSHRALMFGVTAPPAGSQTATMSWTSASNAILGATTYSGVSQTVPFDSGVNEGVNAGFSDFSLEIQNPPLVRVHRWTTPVTTSHAKCGARVVPALGVGITVACLTATQTITTQTPDQRWNVLETPRVSAGSTSVPVPVVYISRGRAYPVWEPLAEGAAPALLLSLQAPAAPANPVFEPRVPQYA